MRHIQACPNRFLAQKTCVILRKRWPSNDSFLLWGGKLVTIYKPRTSTQYYSGVHTLNLKGTASPTRPLNGHKKWRWCGHTTSSKVAMVSTSRQHHRNICPILAHAHIGAIMPETLESTPPSPRLALGRRSQKPTMRLSPETDAARHRARQGIREYELIWLLQQRLRAVSWPHWRLRCMQPLQSADCTATAWELSDLDHSHAAIPQRVTRASCAQLLRSVLGAACRWFAGSSWLVCVCETGLLLLLFIIAYYCIITIIIYRTSAASVELRPRGWRAVAFPRWLQVLSCLTWFIIRCCINSLVSWLHVHWR